MKVGSQIHTNSTTWPQALEVAQLMDRGPWASVWVPDHFVPPLGGSSERGGVRAFQLIFHTFLL